MKDGRRICQCSQMTVSYWLGIQKYSFKSTTTSLIFKKVVGFLQIHKVRCCVTLHWSLLSLYTDNYCQTTLISVVAVHWSLLSHYIYFCCHVALISIVTLQQVNGKKYQYDPKVGFTLNDLSIRDSGAYACRATLEDSVETKRMYVRVLKCKCILWYFFNY